MNIRLATIADKEPILQLLDEMSVMFHASDVPSQIGGPVFEEIIEREDTKIFVAEDKGKLIGLATLYMLPNIRHGWHRGHIEDFFVTEKYRGKGIGTQLFAAIKVFCHKQGLRVIKLDSEKNLVAAHAFYEKNGGRYTENMFRFDIT